MAMKVAILVGGWEAAFRENTDANRYPKTDGRRRRQAKSIRRHILNIYSAYWPCNRMPVLRYKGEGTKGAIK